MFYVDVRGLQREEWVCVYVCVTVCVCDTEDYLTYKTYLLMWAVLKCLQM